MKGESYVPEVVKEFAVCSIKLPMFSPANYEQKNIAAFAVYRLFRKNKPKIIFFLIQKSK